MRVFKQSVKRRLSRVEGDSSNSTEVRAEVEESPLLEAVTRERLAKTEEFKDLA
jgi:hypothetical protein